jgi:hypothetical protein
MLLYRTAPWADQRTGLGVSSGLGESPLTPFNGIDLTAVRPF